MLFRSIRALIAAAFLTLQAGGVFAEEVRAACPSADAPDYFFPVGVFDEGSKRSDWDPDAFHRDWYSKHLHAAGALSLSCGGLAPKETYRFVWLRTFHHPIIIQVTRLESSVEVSSAELNGLGGYDPGRIKRRGLTNRSVQDWDRLTKALTAVGFWNPAADKVSPDEDVIGLDGAQWIFEGRRENQYHVIDRWSPEGNPTRELGLTFLAIAKIHVRQRELY